MARVEYRKAAKDYPAAGIKKGDRYYTWKLHRHAPRMRSKTEPLPEQLTTSEYLGEWYPLNRDIGAFDGDAEEARSLAERAKDLGEEQREKYDNMPDGLQQGDTGLLLEERADEAEGLGDELDEAADELESAQDDLSEAKKERDELIQREAGDELEEAEAHVDDCVGRVQAKQEEVQGLER